LAALEIRHPDPTRLQSVLRNLGLDAVVAKSATTAIRATLDTPKGQLVLD
jgi:hypothetical protein